MLHELHDLDVKVDLRIDLSGPFRSLAHNQSKNLVRQWTLRKNWTIFFSNEKSWIEAIKSAQLKSVFVRMIDKTSNQRKLTFLKTVHSRYLNCEFFYFEPGLLFPDLHPFLC